MAFDTSNFLVIGGVGPAYPNDVYIHERENNNGQPGRVLTMGDAKGTPEEIAQQYIQDGFDPSRIIINGQPASDVFKKQTEQKTDTDAAVKSTGMPAPVVAMNPAQAVLYSALAKGVSGGKGAQNGGNSTNSEGIQPTIVMTPTQAMLYNGLLNLEQKRA